MGFDVTDFLGGLYGTAETLRRAATTDPSGDPGPEATAAGPPGFDFSAWVRRPDAAGQWGWEAPDLTERQRWWAHPENVIDPGEPCPDCGSLERWWDALGGEHCQRCEGGQLARAQRFMEKAARARGAVGTGEREIQEEWS